MSSWAHSIPGSNPAEWYSKRYRTEEKPPAASDEHITQLVEPRMKELKDATGYIAFRDDLTNERSRSRAAKDLVAHLPQLRWGSPLLNAHALTTETGYKTGYNY